ncbi:BgTH12-00618 [Blumeria graminis f. sp. triticale]|uniref:BgTH12-00618 n=1 Tax=Blumeria graminis f. sp. triticale TaxID=1689686 RepID=A0A9W4D6L9_BLUGR|nr:BgTH12-00618 [Blumeria graminis f. sp. triticale]
MTRQKSTNRRKSGRIAKNNAIAVIVPKPKNKWKYQPFQPSTTVKAILESLSDSNIKQKYKIEYDDGLEEEASLSKILSLPNGLEALEVFTTKEIVNGSKSKRLTEIKATEPVLNRRQTRSSASHSDLIGGRDPDLASETSSDDLNVVITKKRRLNDGWTPTLTDQITPCRRSSRVGSKSLDHQQLTASSARQNSSNTRDSSQDRPKTSKSRNKTLSPYFLKLHSRSHTTRPNSNLNKELYKSYSNLDHESDNESDELASKARKHDTKFSSVRSKISTRSTRSTKKFSGSKLTQSANWKTKEDDDYFSSPVRETRRSGRQIIKKTSLITIDKKNDGNNDDDGDDDASDSDDDSEDDEDASSRDELSTTEELSATPKVMSIREVYPLLSLNNKFRKYHNNTCDVCGGIDNHPSKSSLIYCQGCSTSIHKVCLGHRHSRRHMVTKVGHENFVLQCHRCIGAAAEKDATIPRLDKCQVCRQTGSSCAAFSTKKTAKQEEKIREENDGDDPITQVSSHLINNPKNVLFRCVTCKRATHFEHLPPLSKDDEKSDDIDILREIKLKEYKSKWRCKDCQNNSAKVHRLVCWRPLERESFSNQAIEDLCADSIEYLIKWEEKSYFECTWMPGSWVWGVTQKSMRKAFLRRNDDDNMLLKWSFEEAVPEDYLRIDIVLDVRYTHGFNPKSEKSDQIAINMVDEIYVKFKGLGYDDIAWVSPPKPEDSGRWSDFVAAYHEYIAGKYFPRFSAASMEKRIESFRKLDFAKRVELKKQPSQLSGGKMMPYQMEGLNWLLYKFHQKNNVVLADEMGLGKTIQIIALFATLAKNNPICWPFLVITPNSTCANWRREIKKWAPSLRVVSYYGPKSAREVSMKYEMYPDGCTDLRAHVVVTSYETPIDGNSKSWFSHVKWSGLIVDEGQRLKNDRNLLYVALKSLHIPFRILLTGTPLQNNKRELFNLLQFLDPKINAAKLEDQYQILTKENLPEIHELIRPFFLRRTKLGVLKFLPPMVQVIVPVSMSIVQKKLYKSILAKNPDLIRRVFGQPKANLAPTERGNLNNILMQLRKCLCHPFLYSTAIEERSASEEAIQRNLIDASSKLQLLEIMLPKLQERGHRILIFSQFLNNLDLIEDFLTNLNLSFQRLDGSISSLEKQKRIDAFNQRDSPYFAFLLSTRAGGVGINLATADTVLIMRIGQKKKVTVLQLMTKNSVEEKIIQIGRGKMALDQALIESMGTGDDDAIDLESILQYGAEALFNDDDQNDIHYDSNSVDKLLDDIHREETNSEEDKPAESQFAFARVWANDKGSLAEYQNEDDQSATPNFSAWDKILEQREADAAIEAAKNMETFGRGKRARQMKHHELEAEDSANQDSFKDGDKRPQDDHSSDFEFSEASDSYDEGSVSSRHQKGVTAVPHISKPPLQITESSELSIQGYSNRYSTTDGSKTVNSFTRSYLGDIQRSTNVSEQRIDSDPAKYFGSYQSYPQTQDVYYRPDQTSNGIIYSWDGLMQPIPRNENVSQQLQNSTHPIYRNNQMRSAWPQAPYFSSACYKCGLTHGFISRTCPSTASVVQIRIMLDTLARSNIPNFPRDKLESVLRDQLAQRSQRIHN